MTTEATAPAPATTPAVDVVPPAAAATPEAPPTLEQATATANEPYDAFSTAFDSLNVEPPKKETLAVETPPADDKAPADASTATPPAADATLPADTTPATSAPAAAVPAVDTTDYKAEAERLRAELAAAKAAPPATDVDDADEDDTPPPTAQKPKEPEPALSTEDAARLKEYREQWPEVAVGEALARHEDMSRMTLHIFNEMARVYGPVLQRSERAADVVAETAALQIIRDVHPDYDQAMFTEVSAWANSLTGFQKRAALNTIKEGSPEEVVDLVAAFKQTKTGTAPAATSAAATATPPAAAAKPKATVTPLTSAAIQAARAMGAVDTKRTATTPTSEDKNDFEGTWASIVAQ